MTKTRNLADLGKGFIQAGTASAELELLELIDKYDPTEEQRRIILDANTKPLVYRQWFYDQFTRNR